MTFGSLFSGIGGFDLGFGRAGLTCSWQVENDVRCNDMLARHWPDVKRYGDVKDVGEGLEAVDLICGGFPCQDVSVAGRRKGLAGKRSGLWFEFHRILAEIKPSWLVVENVPGLLSSNGGRDFGTILRGLAELGYLSAWRVLDAQYFGVAQRRRRVFIVGHLGDGCAAEVLFERESGAWDSPPSREAGEKVTAPIKASPPSRRGGGSSPIAEEFVVAGTLGGAGGKRGWCDDLDRSGAFVPVVSRPLAHGRTGDHYDESQQTYVFDWQSGGDVRHNISESHSSALQPNQTPAIVKHALSGHNQRNDPDGEHFVVTDLYPTLRGQPNQGPGRMADDSAVAGVVRRLTPTECERLQGFPDGWTDGQSDSARYQQLGNAVCVPVAEWIGKRIYQAQMSMEAG